MRYPALIVAGLLALTGGTQASPLTKSVPSLTGPDGTPVAFDALVGPEPLVVNLWATWCGPCRDELPSLVELAAWLKPHGGRVILVSLDEIAIEQVNWYLDRRLGLTLLDSYLDDSGKLEQHFNVLYYPTTLIFDSDGTLLATVEGGEDWNSSETREYLASLFPDRDDLR